MMELLDELNPLVKQIQTKEARLEELKDEAGKISERCRKIQDAVEELRAQITALMLDNHCKTAKCAAATLSLRDPVDKVVVANKDRVPEEFCKAKITVLPDLEKITAHFRDTGELIDGCDVLKGVCTLQIRRF
jgi:predicted nuclease with TOPRIM domain